MTEKSYPITTYAILSFEISVAFDKKLMAAFTFVMRKIFSSCPRRNQEPFKVP